MSQGRVQEIQVAGRTAFGEACSVIVAAAQALRVRENTVWLMRMTNVLSVARMTVNWPLIDWLDSSILPFDRRDFCAWMSSTILDPERSQVPHLYERSMLCPARWSSTNLPPDSNISEVRLPSELLANHSPTSCGS